MRSTYKLAIALAAAAAIGGAAIQGLHAQAKPLAYVITEVTITDEAAFKEFAAKTDATIAPFGGKRLVRGGKVVALDGEAPKRVIVVVYDSMEKAQAQRDSAAWKALLPMRNKATKTREYMVEGVAN